MKKGIGANANSPLEKLCNWRALIEGHVMEVHSTGVQWPAPLQGPHLLIRGSPLPGKYARILQYFWRIHQHNLWHRRDCGYVSKRKIFLKARLEVSAFSGFKFLLLTFTSFVPIKLSTNTNENQRFPKPKVTHITEEMVPTIFPWAFGRGWWFSQPRNLAAKLITEICKSACAISAFLNGLLSN